MLRIDGSRGRLELEHDFRIYESWARYLLKMCYQKSYIEDLDFTMGSSVVLWIHTPLLSIPICRVHFINVRTRTEYVAAKG